ncbi:hypothetical protein VKT23_018011 [Stygiomarasmius scandens]|uniref:Transmembrane protein n=1 Tax=Marasmiellus scandens TaxID=2682957 RepID=A0ABR1IRV4_9AGAR
MVHLDFLHIDAHSVSLQRLVLDNKAAVEAFTNDPITPNAADIYYTSFGNGAMFRTGTYIALTIVADIFIVYRVFAVWARNIWVSLIPFLLAIADIVSGALVIRTIRHLEAGASPDGNDIATHILVFYGFTLALNVLCTLLIALRFWIAQRQAAANKIASSMDLSTTLVIVVESAALYSVCLVVMLVPTAMGNNAQYCMLSMMPGIVGLAFSLVIVRVGSGVSPNATSAGPGSGLQFAAFRSEFATSQLGEQSHFENESTNQSHSEGPHERGGISVHFGRLGTSSKNTQTSTDGSTHIASEKDDDGRMVEV